LDPGPKSERSQRRILEAARAVFRQHGYAESTVELIVEEAGVSRGAFYTYFESKADVFRQLASQVEDRLEANVVSFERTGTDLIGRLRISTRNYLAIVRDNLDLYQLVEQMAATNPEARAARTRSRRHHVARVSKTIRGGWRRDSRIPSSISN